MQHIGLKRENETGEVLEISDLNCVDILEAVFSREAQVFPLLRTIDPYGETSLNYLQIPLYQSELEKLKNEVRGHSLGLLIDHTLDFMKKTEQFTFCKFIGD